LRVPGVLETTGLVTERARPRSGFARSALECGGRAERRHRFGSARSASRCGDRPDVSPEPLVCRRGRNGIGPGFLTNTLGRWRQLLRGRKRLACRPILAAPFEPPESHGVRVLLPRGGCAWSPSEANKRAACGYGRSPSTEGCERSGLALERPSRVGAKAVSPLRSATALHRTRVRLGQ